MSNVSFSIIAHRCSAGPVIHYPCAYARFGDGLRGESSGDNSGQYRRAIGELGKDTHIAAHRLDRFSQR